MINLSCAQKVIGQHMASYGFSCYICGLEVDDPMKLEIHLNIHAGALMFECGHCEMAYSNERQLRAHLAHTHPQAGDPIRCSFCPELFASTTKAAAHERLHTKARCPMCLSTQSVNLPPCTLYLHSHANSLHRNQVPELLRKFNLLEGLHAEHSADNIADIMAKRGLTGSYKLDPALIPKLCEPCDMITMNKPSKVVLHKLFSPRSSSLVAAEIDTFYSILGISKAKIRYIDMFQIYRIAPCCGRQFDTLGRFNRHVKACYPEVYQNLMIKDTTIAAPSNITYAKIKAKQLARKENMIAKSSQSNSAEKDQRPKFECPVCHKELSAATFLTNHIRRLHPEIQLAKMKVKRVKI